MFRNSAAYFCIMISVNNAAPVGITAGSTLAAVALEPDCASAHCTPLVSAACEAAVAPRRYCASAMIRKFSAQLAMGMRAPGAANPRVPVLSCEAPVPGSDELLPGAEPL